MNLKLYLRRQKELKLEMFAHNTEEVTESEEYGEAVFDAEVIHPEVDNLFTLKTVNMCTKRVQLKVWLIHKSPRSL